MAEYRVTGPDGSTYRVTGPAGATKSQVMSKVREKISSQYQNPDPQRRANVPIEDVTYPAERLGSGLGLSPRDTGPQRRAPSREERFEAVPATQVDGQTVPIEGESGAPADARFLGNLAVTEPGSEDEQRIISGALEATTGKKADVRLMDIGGKNELMYRLEGQEAYRPFNKVGTDIGDVAAAGVEGGQMAGEGLGALAGGMLGTAAGGPGAGTGAGAISGATAASFGINYARLKEAQRQGLPISDEEIFQRAVTQAGITAGASAAGPILAKIVQRLGGKLPDKLAAVLGDDADPDKLDAKIREAEDLQREFQKVTGKDLPLTSGQVTQNPGMIRGEWRARKFGATGAPVRSIDEQQDQAIDVLNRITLGDALTPEQRTQAGREVAQAGKAAQRKAMGPRKSRVPELERQLDEAEAQTTRSARVPESAMSSARTRLQGSREQVLKPMREDFNQLQQERGIKIDLTPVREEAQRLQREEGQDIFRSISLQSQSQLLDEAQRAGQKTTQQLELGADNLLQWVERTQNENVPLGNIQLALRDIRRQLRRPEIQNEPQKERILSQMKRALVQARNAGIEDADTLQRIERLESGYADAMRRYDEGIVGALTELDEKGLPRLSGQDAVRRLTSDAETAQEFVEAVDGQPEGSNILIDAQDAVLGYVRDQFMDSAGDVAEPSAFRKWLRRNDRALQTLFSNRPEMLNRLQGVESAARAVKQNQDKLETIRQRAEKAFGFSTAEPATLVSNLMSEGRVSDLKRARQILPRERRPFFDQAVANEVRRQITRDGNVDPERLSKFLDSQLSNVASDFVGKDYKRNLRLLNNVLQTAQRRTTDQNAPQDLSEIFGREVKAFEGPRRFLRVFFAPLSRAGRALTAATGMTQEQAQRQAANILADPQKLRRLLRIRQSGMRSRDTQAILSNLGLEAYTQAARQQGLLPAEKPSESATNERQNSGGNNR